MHQLDRVHIVHVFRGRMVAEGLMIAGAVVLAAEEMVEAGLVVCAEVAIDNGIHTHRLMRFATTGNRMGQQDIVPCVSYNFV